MAAIISGTVPQRQRRIDGRQRRFQSLRRPGLGARMRRYPALGKGRISEALHVEHGMTKNKLTLRAAPALNVIQ
ncbi:hypothetical protein [Dongia sp.]|uniref:hypothetical protein n=1 Tax=Dongia sp. TaxID=1977262 RepID=UPI00375320F1